LPVIKPACAHVHATVAIIKQAVLQFVVTASEQQLCCKLCKLHKLHSHQASRLQCSVQLLGVATKECAAGFGVAVHQHTDE